MDRLGLLLLAFCTASCGTAPAAQPPTVAACGTAGSLTPANAAGGEAALTPAPAPTLSAPGGSCRTDQDCRVEGPCKRARCEEGICKSPSAPDGAECTPVEEWIEGPTRCYAGECYSRRVCAKACLFEVSASLKPDADRLNAACPSREKNATQFAECVKWELSPGSELGKRLNRQVHDCMVTCGYPPLLTEDEIEELNRPRKD